MEATTETMRAWVGCLACYNDGRLVGEWVDAVDAADSVDDPEWCIGVHGPALADDEAVAGHEEWWCFDHEGLPIDGECSPMHAAALADLLSEVEEWRRGAVLAWMREGNYSTDVEGLPILSDFDDAYRGEYDSPRDYAETWAEEAGLVPEEYTWPTSCIDWEQATWELMMDHYTAPAPNGGVYVFRSC
jgi:antirestriction protein